MRIVLDTNMLVSGLHNPDGTPGRIVDLVMGGRIQLLYDDRILGEYLDVLARPELEIDSSLARAVVGYIRLAGERVTALPLPADTLPDPDDLPFAEVAASGAADALVTGNTKHFARWKEQGNSVLSPAQFLERLT
ncbi:MAG: putative toxin-antitoxin system toxin component, PIN family [Anaerolineales bacterium]|nr:putative toxin-antitoxin system toxin component, PIN family [Anaerolineales bacterium]